MLFQGEEWAASTPFAFFTSHPEPELGRATAEGRLAPAGRGAASLPVESRTGAGGGPMAGAGVG